VSHIAVAKWYRFYPSVHYRLLPTRSGLERSDFVQHLLDQWLRGRSRRAAAGADLARQRTLPAAEDKEIEIWLEAFQQRLEELGGISHVSVAILGG
jgi:hypothetical protein